MTDIYHLKGRYYQKLGEAWDHEVKDFKVLYKPLYACDSKQGSFEAHFLATSTFERWTQKFEKLTPADIHTLPPAVTAYIVSVTAIDNLGVGERPFPSTTTYSLPAGMSHRRASVTVEENHTTNTLSGTDSGFGSRSHKKYYTLDFSPEFENMILSGEKTATTRVISSSVEGAEPSLADLACSIIGNRSGKNIIVRATTGSDSRIFALLEIIGVEYKKYSSLTDELARIEQFDSVTELKQCLLRFYPSISESDDVAIFYFKCHVPNT